MIVDSDSFAREIDGTVLERAFPGCHSRVIRVGE